MLLKCKYFLLVDSNLSLSAHEVGEANRQLLVACQCGPSPWPSCLAQWPSSAHEAHPARIALLARSFVGGRGRQARISAEKQDFDAFLSSFSSPVNVR